MLIALGIMTAAAGVFLFLWYRTIVSLPLKRRPPFIRSGLIKWGMPCLSLVLFVLGVYLVAAVSFLWAILAFALSALFTFLVLKFDRYSADARVIFDRYLRIRESNPGLTEDEVLYFTAEWRYPQWSSNRLVELVAGKDIEGLILLMLTNEHGINPLSDWELFRDLKAKIARMVRTGKVT